MYSSLLQNLENKEEYFLLKSRYKINSQNSPYNSFISFNTEENKEKSFPIYTDSDIGLENFHLKDRKLFSYPQDINSDDSIIKTGEDFCKEDLDFGIFYAKNGSLEEINERIRLKLIEIENKKQQRDNNQDNLN